MWERVSNWSAVFPFLGSPTVGLESHELDGISGQWQLNINKNRGRLYVEVQHIRIGSPDGDEALAVKLIARGPVDDTANIRLWPGIELGHESIVNAFVEMSSLAAHERWKRER